MQADTQAHVAFFLTGRRAADGLDPVAGLGLKPALFAAYEDLSELRYDYPVVLDARASGAAGIVSMSSLFDRALEKAAQGEGADRVRRHGLRLEREIRVLVAGGAGGTLGEMFERAAARLAAQADASFEDSRKRIRAAFTVDGELADCDAVLPQRLLQHVWSKAQEAKAAAFGQRLRKLVLKLQAILDAEVERSPQGVTHDRLVATFGPGFAGDIDFAAMSRLLARARSKEAMPAARKRRINELLRVLKAQRFFPEKASGGWSFTFDSCVAALKAWRDRHPKLLDLARALIVAQLEVDGEYRAERHDDLFEAYGAVGLEPGELAEFPDYLVVLNDAKLSAEEQAALMEVLSSGLPIKVLLQADDLGDAQAPGQRSRQLASLAMGLNTAYVLQASASHLVQLRERLVQGLAYRGPTLFNVYSGANARSTGMPPYLMAAAAMESRAFPAFTYDPSAGANWAARFSLEGNPQAELDWPVRRFTYEDEAQQGITEEVPFTVVDFLAADGRYASHLARVPREKWNGSLMAVDASLATQKPGVPSQVPSILMVDGEHRLQRVIVDQALLRQASRCREQWHSLQELGGIHNSHAEKLLAQQQAKREAEAASQVAAPAPAAVAAPAPAAVPVAASAPEEPQRNPDEAYIETERCSSCNECTQLNNKMFAYNENQQAYIKDVNAGTYAQLVEAAESCQVAVIHPGKPRNKNEPGLEELMKRAEVFA
jgi:ferredoxin